MATPQTPCFLVADIGGTNTRVALCRSGALQSQTIRRYQNAAFDGFDAVLKAYMAENRAVQPDAVCVAIAGPVRDGRGYLTNRDWDVDDRRLAEISGASHVALLNDLQAQGYALPYLAPQDLIPVRTGGPVNEGSARLAVNLGTGFNASPVFQTPAGPYVATSESGHASMPTRSARDVALCRFVDARQGFAAIDDILSGRGLETVYAFVAEDAGTPRTASSADIIAGCATGSDAIAVATVSYFIELTARVVGNLALVQLPFGGIYLVGGLASAIAPFIETADFEAAFRDKGRFAQFMDNFGVCIVQDDYAALKGMAVYLDALHASAQP